MKGGICMNASQCHKMSHFRPNQKQLRYASAALVLGQNADEMELYQASGVHPKAVRSWENVTEFCDWLSRVFQKGRISVDLDTA